MRELTGVIGTLVILIGAIFASPLGASASSAAPAPAPGSHNRAFAAAPAPKFPASSRPRVAAPISCDGQFHVAASPSGTGNSYLEMVSPVNANDVWAVGIQNDTSTSSKTLAEHWNGSTWGMQATVSPSANHNSLFGVTAVSSSDVWAVGAYTINNPSLLNSATLAEHWNGTSWIKVATPNPSVASYLFAVTAVSSSSVWAVGTYFDFGANSYVPLVEHYNGSSWTASFPPAVGTTQTELFAVSALNDNDIWAVGSFENGAYPLQDLAAHWDGGTWTMWNPPDTGSGDNEILGVNVLESGHAVGVGYGSGGSPAAQAAAWDLLASGVMTRVDLPGSVNDNVFNSVARSSGSVWAVGFDQGSTMVRAGTWDLGTHTLTWAGAPGASDNPSGSFNDYFAVAAISPSVFWATGFETSGTTDHTLAEVHCDLALGLSAPATAAASLPFSVTVTAKNPNASTKASYDGTVHFTSSDSQAVLPADYTFTPGDVGVHTFNGVVLKDPYNQPSTITVSDVATPFVNASAAVNVACLGVCQSPAGSPGGRDANQSPAGTPGARGVNQAPTGTPPPRLPAHAPKASLGSRVPSTKPAAPTSSAAPRTETASASMPRFSSVPVRAGAHAVTVDHVSMASSAAPVSTTVPAARRAPVSPGPDRTPWYLLLLLPLLIAGLVIHLRYARLGF